MILYLCVQLQWIKGLPETPLPLMVISKLPSTSVHPLYLANDPSPSIASRLVSQTKRRIKEIIQ